MFCNYCGFKNEEGAKFCSHCGSTITASNEKNQETLNQNENITLSTKKNGIAITSWIGFPISLVFRLLFQQEFHVWNNLIDGEYVYKLDTIPSIVICFIVFLFSVITVYKGSKGKYKNKQSVYLSLAIFTVLALLAIFVPISKGFFDF